MLDAFGYVRQPLLSIHYQLNVNWTMSLSEQKEHTPHISVVVSRLRHVWLTRHRRRITR